jgi:hypothetical protein
MRIEHPQHVAPPKTLANGIRSFVFIFGIGMMQTMSGNPEDGSTLKH